MKVNIVFILILLSYLNTSCSGIETKNVTSTPSCLVNMKELTGDDSIYVNFSYLIDSCLNELYVINGDSIYFVGLKSQDIKRCATWNIVSRNELKKSYFKLIYYEFRPALIIYRWDRNLGIDSLLQIAILDSQLRKPHIIDVRIKNSEMLKDMYLVSAIKRIDLASDYSLIVTCDQSNNYLINEGEISYYRNKNGDHAMYDATTRDIYAIGKIPKQDRIDYYLYKNMSLKDTLLIASNDSVFKSYLFMGNPIIIGSRLFVKSSAAYYELNQRRWMKLHYVNLGFRIVSNGKGLLWNENGSIHIESF